MRSRASASPVNSYLAVTAVTAGVAALAYAAVFAYAGPEDTLLGLACLSSVVICLLPFWIRRETDIFQPMGYILGMTIIAMPLRHLYLMLAPDQQVLGLTNREPTAFFIPGALMVNIALAALVCGYIWTTYRVQVERTNLFAARVWRSPPLYWFVTIVLAGISTVAFITIVRLSGFEVTDNIADLSRKRALPSNVAAGYLKWAAELVDYAFFITIAYMMSRRGRITAIGCLALFVLAAMAMVPAFFSSSRTGVLETAVIGLAIYFYRGGKLSLWRAVLVMAPILAITSIITMFRGPGATWTGWGDAVNPLAFLATLAGAFNKGGFVATSHIINSVNPEDHTFGSTLAFWSYAWIPRSMWPDKPLEVGYLMLEKFLQFRGDIDKRVGGGAAAGLPAELYLNFGPYILPIGMFIYGSCLRVVYNSLRSIAHSSPLAAVLCATLSFTLTYGCYGNGLSRGMIPALKDVTMFLVLFAILLRWKRASQTEYLLRSTGRQHRAVQKATAQMA